MIRLSPPRRSLAGLLGLLLLGACSDSSPDGSNANAEPVPTNPTTGTLPTTGTPDPALTPTTPSSPGEPGPAPTGSAVPNPTLPDPNTPAIPTNPTNLPPAPDGTTPLPDSSSPTPLDPPDTAEQIPSLIGDVTFSVPSQTFAEPLSVSLTGPQGAEIRYTTDGSLPTASSPLYAGSPISVAETTQLRAQAFASGTPSGFPSTALYVARTADVQSEIPIVIIEGYAGGRPEKTVTFNFGGGNTEEPEEVVPDPYFDAAFMLFEPVEGVASIANLPSLATRAGYRERGQSSANAEKSPYKVELWDNYDEDSDYPLLGMPAEADWAFIGEYFDKSQIQNALVYGWGEVMGLATVRTRFVELYINFDGGPIEPTDYFGLYMVAETIKNQKNRLNLKQLRETDTALPDISGGYIFKFDQAALDGGEARLVCTGSEPFARTGGGGFGGGSQPSTPSGHCWNDLGVVDPDAPNTEQVTWLTNYVQGFHDALHTDPIGDYAQFIDLASFIDHTIINEITRDVDAYVRSSYFHKERDEPIKAGPLWDYNLAMASISNASFEGWHFESQATGRGNSDWFLMLGRDPAFLAQLAARYRELRLTLLSDASISAQIDAIQAPIASAAQRDADRWPNAGVSFGGGGGGGRGGGTMAAPRVWLDEVAKLRAWLPQRLAWLDNTVAGL